MKLLSRRSAPPPPSSRATGGLAPITWPADSLLAVSRYQAMGLSVVANARNTICGIASQLQVERFRGDEAIPPGTILTQPDPDTTWAAMIAATVDSLMFYGKAYWLVLQRDSDGNPTRARLLPYGTTAPWLSQDWTRLSRVLYYQIAGQEIPPQDVIAFQMGGAGILTDSAAVLLDAIALHAAASRFATVPLPAGVLTNEGQEVGPADAAKIVADFDAARQTGSTALLQSMKYERTALNAADLQLVEALAAMDARLARVCNVPVASVGTSPTGGTHAQVYANLVATLGQLVQTSVAPYLRVIEDSLAAQATPRGQSVVFDTAGYLRFAMLADPTAAAPVAPITETTP